MRRHPTLDGTALGGLRPWLWTGLRVALAGLALRGTARAETIRVPDDVPSIGEALEQAEDGDEIVVAPGEYHERIDFQGKSVLLRSLEGPETTTISPESAAVDPSAGSVVTFGSGESREAILEGFTVTGGTGSFVHQDDDIEAVAGGGILIANGSSPTIRGNVIRDNSAVATGEEPTTGGGVAILGRGSALLEGNQILGNDARAGGGVAAAAGSRPELRANLFHDNAAEFGGGVAIGLESAPRMERNVVRGNRAKWGGGIYVHTWAISPGGVEPWPETAIVESEVAGNQARTAGAGVCIYQSRVAIERCVISRNVVEFTMEGGWGGGLYVDSSAVRVASCLLDRNSGYYGGGIFARGEGSEIRLEHLTIFANSGSVGGGVATPPEATPDMEIHNSIFWENRGGLVGESANLYNGNPEKVHNCDFSDGLYEGRNGNFSADPLFRDSRALDLHIAEGSPCIDRGAELPGSGEDLDIDGDPRAVDGDGDGTCACDVGADEYIPPGLVRFVRSDANADGSMDLSDAVTILLYLFVGTVPDLQCEAAADCDDAGSIEITDAVLLLDHLFLGERPPRAPYPDCGVDPTPGDLPCASYPPCEPDAP